MVAYPFASNAGRLMGFFPLASFRLGAPPFFGCDGIRGGGDRPAQARIVLLKPGSA